MTATKTRYKKVFASHNELAHIWAQQSQEEGRASNMFFEGESIYSWGKHFEIARFIDENTVLFYSGSRSVSTSKHQSLVLRAINHKTVFQVPDLLAVSYGRHDKNIKYFIDQINECLTKSIKARTNKDWLLRSAEGWAEELKQYAEHFGLDIADEYKNREFLSEESREKLKEQVEAARKAELIKRKEEIEEWIRGEKYSLPRSISKIFLRRNGEWVETSYGARVDALRARILYRCIQQGRDVKGTQIDYYTIIDLNEKFLKVGCHTIERSEINRFAKSQNW